MCGIAGAINKDFINVDEVINSIRHRGPDNEGHYEYRNVFLAHTRLSILDLSERGNQPMILEDGKYVIVFNGEIYNHLELRKQLSEHSFRSNSDTETVLACYRRYGKDCLNLFNGIFAFALLDVEKNKLLIARDQMGVKPLYYYQNNSCFLFSSEIKALKSFEIDKSINYKALSNYLTYMWSPGEMTPFSKVRKLLPGHYLEIDINCVNDLKPVSYYKIPFEGEYDQLSEKEWVDRIENTLFEAVKRQMLSDAPLGFFLSGGLDSSLVVAMARKHFPNRQLPCFTIDTGSNSSSGFARDCDYAVKVGDYLGIKPTIIEAKVDIVKDFDTMIWHLDEPQADPAPLNVLNICHAAQTMGIKVLLSGTGGDDIFSGYRRHQSLRMEPFLQHLPLFIRKLSKRIVNAVPAKNYRLRRLKKLLNNFDSSVQQRMIGYFQWLTASQVLNLFSDEIKNQLKGFDPTAYFKILLNEIPKEENLLNQMLYMEIYSFLVDHNLNYTDKMGMATGVEIRVPYLDMEVVNQSVRIPPALKMKGNTTKYILRKVAERYLPKEVIYRPKTGFGAPIEKWIKQDLSHFIDNRLNEKTLIKDGIFNHKSVQNLISENKEGKINAAYPIWCLVSIQSWLEQFVKN